MPRRKTPVDTVTITAGDRARVRGVNTHETPPVRPAYVLCGAASYMTPWGNNYERNVPFQPAHNDERAFVAHHPDFEEV